VLGATLTCLLPHSPGSQGPSVDWRSPLQDMGGQISRSQLLQLCRSPAHESHVHLTTVFFYIERRFPRSRRVVFSVVVPACLVFFLPPAPHVEPALSPPAVFPLSSLPSLVMHPLTSLWPDSPFFCRVNTAPSSGIFNVFHPPPKFPWSG